MRKKHKVKLSGDALDMVAERFKILSEPMRLLYSLMDGEKNVTQLVEETGSLQANVSKHLGMMLDAGVVGRRKEGLRAYYRVADESIYELCDLVCGSIQDRLEADLDRVSPAVTALSESRR